jgi:hypothetical protein
MGWLLLAVFVTISTPVGAALLHRNAAFTTDGTNRWTVETGVDFGISEPHIGPTNASFQFTSFDQFSVTGGNFILPGGVQPTLPNPNPGETLVDVGSHSLFWTLSGRGVFDYTKPWSLTIVDNRRLPMITEHFTAGANVEAGATFANDVGSLKVSGNASGEIDYKLVLPGKDPTDPGQLLYRTFEKDQTFELDIIPTSADQGVGIFGSSGRIELAGWIRDTGDGLARLTNDNVYFPALQDFTMANAIPVLVGSYRRILVMA